MGHVLGISLSRKAFPYIAGQSVEDLHAFKRVGDYVANTVQGSKPLVLLGRKSPRRINRKTGRFEDFKAYYLKYRRTKGLAHETEQEFMDRQTTWLSATDTPQHVHAKLLAGLASLMDLLRYAGAHPRASVNTVWQEVMSARPVAEKRQLADMVRLMSVLARSDNLALSKELAHGMAGARFVDRANAVHRRWERCATLMSASHFARGCRRVVPRTEHEVVPYALRKSGKAARRAVKLAKESPGFVLAGSGEESRAFIERQLQRLHGGAAPLVARYRPAAFDDAFFALPEVQALVCDPTLARVLALENTVDVALSAEQGSTYNGCHWKVPDEGGFIWRGSAPYKTDAKGAWVWTGADEDHLTAEPMLL